MKKLTSVIFNDINEVASKEFISRMRDFGTYIGRIDDTTFYTIGKERNSSGNFVRFTTKSECDYYFNLLSKIIERRGGKVDMENIFSVLIKDN